MAQPAAALHRTIRASSGFAGLHTWFFRRSGGSAFLTVFLHTAGKHTVEFD